MLNNNPLDLVPDYLTSWQDRIVSFDSAKQLDLGIPRLYYKLENGRKILVACAGELMVITGTQKSRKTLFQDCMKMSYYTSDENHTLNFELVTDGRPIITFDTEQPKHRTAFNFARFHRICGLKKQPKGLYLINIKALTAFEMTEFITHTLDQIMQLEGQEPAFIGIDQIADLAKGGDVNDPESMDRIHTHLNIWHRMTNHMALLSPIIHTNRGGENTDGRLGKMLDKKCDSQFITTFDPKTHFTNVRHKEARIARIPDFSFRQDVDGVPQLVEVGQFGV